MYMLLQIDKEENGIVDGTHVQWCCACSIEEATKRARGIEKANSNRIAIAVVDELYDSYCLGKRYKGLKRLDINKDLGVEVYNNEKELRSVNARTSNRNIAREMC